MSDLPPTLHPALHFDTARHFASVGLVQTVNGKAETWTVVNASSRLEVWQSSVGRAFLPEPQAYAPLADRWAREDVTRFEKGQALLGDLVEDDGQPVVWGFRYVLNLIRAVLAGFAPHGGGVMEFHSEAHASVVACWVVATYFHQVFREFPRLYLQGERQSGKTKLLQIISDTAFNGLLRINVTPAVLFRLIDPLRPTYCIDEREQSLNPEVEAILNNGYKRGAYVDRVEERRGQREVVPYAVYAPIALASIAAPSGTLQDRSIVIHMQRGMDATKVNAPWSPGNPMAQFVRHACYRLALTRFLDVATTYANAGAPAGWMGRLRELYTPLLTIARLAQSEGEDAYLEDLADAAWAEFGQRPSLPEDGHALFEECETRFRRTTDDHLVVKPGDLVGNIRDRMGLPRVPRSATDHPTPADVGILIGRYKLAKSSTRSSRNMRHEIPRSTFFEQARRFGYPLTEDASPSGKVPDLDAPLPTDDGIAV